MLITVLPGDGIGEEVTSQAIRVLTDVSSIFDVELETQTALIGGVAIRETGDPFPEATRTACLEAKAVLLGSVGSPDFDHLPPDQRPEIGLLKLRQALGGFANLRPSRAVPALIDSSPLRREIFDGTDLVIVRELLGGLYYGQPRGVDEANTEAFNTLKYSVPEVERVARVAFEIARSRRNKLTSVDKANVLEVSQLWRRTVDRIAKDFPDVEVEHLFVDACAMFLVTQPTRFDVVLTENMFGDILSDEAAVLTGSLGMLASATVGGDIDLYEPVHGSAPDIAGQNIANPLGAIASAALLARYTLENENIASTIERAIDQVLEDGYRTVDLAPVGWPKTVSTEEMGDLVLQNAIDNANVSHAYHAV
jgi:3-isopropylmalate dehydrogenase